MQFSVQIEGVDRLKQSTERVRQAIANELAKGMYASVKRVEEEAKKSILQGGKSGRIYHKGKNGTIVHRASAPGEAPASDTGRLANSIDGRIDLIALKSGLLEGTVSTELLYGKHLEHGTRNIAARPFLFPAFERSKSWIKDRLDAAVRKAVISVTVKSAGK